MTFTYTMASPSMPALSNTPIKKADRLRPILAKPSSAASTSASTSLSMSTSTPTSSKFSKSPLKKERDRLLKKYSPMKRRNKRLFSLKKSGDNEEVDLKR